MHASLLLCNCKGVGVYRPTLGVSAWRTCFRLVDPSSGWPDYDGVKIGEDDHRSNGVLGSMNKTDRCAPCLPTLDYLCICALWKGIWLFWQSARIVHKFEKSKILSYSSFSFFKLILHVRNTIILVIDFMLFFKKIYINLILEMNLIRTVLYQCSKTNRSSASPAGM